MLRQAARQLGRLATQGLASQQSVQLAAGPLVAANQVVRQSIPFSHGFSTNSHDLFNTHRNEEYNNEETEFDFTEANYVRVAEVLSRYPSNYKQSACIPLLDLAQQQNSGWLSLVAMNKVAEIMEVPAIRVYEVATFYTMFNRSKIGKLHVMVCGTTPCQLNGSKDIYHAISDHLGIGFGDTTEDGMFTLGEMECMGSCVTGPMIAVADYRNGVEGFSYNYYEDLTPSKAVGIVQDLAAGKVPKMGSQFRSKAEPAGVVNGNEWIPAKNVTRTLAGTPSGPYCRNLDDPPAEAAAPAK